MRRLLLAVSLIALSGAPLSAKTVAKAAAKPAAKSTATKKAAPAAPRAGIMVAPDIREAVDDKRRDPKNVARDIYRHPAQTLSFFGLKPDMTVVEMIPGTGWYTEILAPYLAANGHYVAAVSAGQESDEYRTFLATDPDRFGKVQMTPFDPGQMNEFVPAGSADMILTFRNIHNLLGSPDQPGDGNAGQAFADWFRALKPGGVLGIVEHRLPENMDSAREKTTGYVKRSTVIRLAMAAGFQLAAVSDVNANPKDDHDHPKGVWTLPPSYALGDEDKAKYAAIGESDRMTLRFVKPDPNAAAADASPAPATDPAVTTAPATDPAAPPAPQDTPK
ncbi:class I SAM-dependent methyltransferase [Sphingomonas abietis]|uniref:Methyltransferase n=1 Tax=Sphingomonas abietis TaxID=3012344 RepID=A0ABY7NI99_9SPHN|nr:methyltransferase [Sphingomonas abietis]WBO21002.1 methyltransferase [Sphingomonas abietis]